MNNKTTNVRTILILLLTILVVISLGLIASWSDKTRFNDANAVGNTAGNLNNGGLYCEYNQKIYFANAYDNYSLYSMNSDCSNLQKLNDNYCYSINAAGDYLYYCMQNGAGGSGLGYIMQNSGIYRSKLNGKSVTCLNDGYGMIIQLAGNYLYCQQEVGKGTGLKKHKIDHSDSAVIANYVLNPASCENGIIYFNGTQEDHALYSLNTADDSITKIWDGNIWNPVYDGGYIYYMDISNHYRLTRYNLSDGTTQLLSKDRIDFFNVYQGVIYYQKSDQAKPQLRRMNLDGSDNILIADGIFEHINITSRYVFFNETNLPTPVYRVGTFDSTPSVTEFSEALRVSLGQ